MSDEPRPEHRHDAPPLPDDHFVSETAARQARQVALVADVALALTADEPLAGVLRRCAEALVRHLDAAFARIWMLEPDGATLRLRASAGLYTHLDGAHARVPVGALKIGLIAQEQRPHLTNDVVNDPRVGDHAWAAREGLVSFAGYPLRVAGRLVGVIAAFARKPLAQDVLDVLASVADAIALGIERHRLLAEAQARAEAQSFLAQASALLASSIDYETTLANVARLAVPRVADWCGVDILEPDGTLRQLAVAHVDPAKVELARELRRRFPPDPDATHGVPAVVRTGRAEFTPEIPDAVLVEAAQGKEGLLGLLRELGLRSSMCVPLAVNERVLGALSLVSAESRKVYTEADLQLAEELARRAASAVENARLYAEVRRLNASLERRVEERTAQLTEVNRELEAFTYTVSHDLRAPIRHVGGFTDLLERHLDASLDDKGRRYVRTIRDAAKQMGTLIDALLAFSRIGRAEPRRARVDLDVLTREVVRDLEPETAGRAVAWEISALPAVKGDPTLIRLVLTNLLSNAVKYTRPRPEARIEVGARPVDEPGQVALFVRDNGVGFRPEYVPKLFGVFQRLHNDKQFEGTGVGLATVRRIVQRHGGRVWAEGAEDRGATFFITLPLAESTPP